MKEIRITYDNQTVKFGRTEDSGWKRGGWCANLPNGDLIVVRRNCRDNAWLEVCIHNQVAIRSMRHRTRQAALNSAALKIIAANWKPWN